MIAALFLCRPRDRGVGSSDPEQLGVEAEEVGQGALER
jgi:hypothetical protein